MALVQCGIAMRMPTGEQPSGESVSCRTIRSSLVRCELFSDFDACTRLPDAHDMSRINEDRAVFNCTYEILWSAATCRPQRKARSCPRTLKNAVHSRATHSRPNCDGLSWVAITEALKQRRVGPPQAIGGAVSPRSPWPASAPRAAREHNGGRPE